MSAVEDRLAELGLSVPDVATPAGAYVPALREGNLVFTSGQLPMVSGDLPQTGKVGDPEEKRRRSCKERPAFLVAVLRAISHLTRPTGSRPCA